MNGHNLKKLVILLLVLSGIFIFSDRSLAQTFKAARQVFNQANRAYEQGDYQKAARLYQQLLKRGYESGNLYYNLGNCHYKLHHQGWAILYYEKARRLIPNDADLKANLTFVAKGSNSKSYNNPLAHLASLDQLLILSSSFFFLLVAMIITSILAKQALKDETGKLKLWWRCLLGVVSVVFLLGLLLTTFTWVDHSQPQAVVVNRGAVARYEPNTSSTVYYKLPEGIRVKVLTVKAGWSMVQRGDGRSGWVKNEYLERI
ncbi:MAG TPA: tetratricopeptide repeat protein [Bacillota bacterium]